MKCIQINGLRIDSKIRFVAKHGEYEFEFIFCPYSEYLKIQNKFINPYDIEECKTVVIYSSMGNNSIETYYIKVFISMLYFAYRIQVEEQREKKFYSDPLYSTLGVQMMNERYRKHESPHVKNWNLRGFWNDGYINNIHWCIKLGKNEMTCDDFESYLTRAYGGDLCDSYDTRYLFWSKDEEIEVDDELIDIIGTLNGMINEESEFGNKLKSALRLYYELFMIYSNMNISIITISTILETLLLGEDEDNQRKKVSVRSACLLFEHMEKKWKTSLADSIYFFYKYRNAIVHRGKNYLDFDEVQLNNVTENMKHVILGLVYYYYKNKPQHLDDIKDCVIRSFTTDGISNAFEYISPDANETYHLLLPED
ncbi:MAG: HEPN domain-containing protein [Lachnospiraceae bacterium]|nr:HEPN domain-containing protein [Lachnospiraceae bacterium]